MRLRVRTMGGKCEVHGVDSCTSVEELQRHLHRTGCVDVPPEEQKMVRRLAKRIRDGFERCRDRMEAWIRRDGCLTKVHGSCLPRTLPVTWECRLT